MNAASTSSGADYAVIYDHDEGAIKFTAATNTTFFLVHDDLLTDPGFQAALETKTGAARTPWTPDWRNTRSAMQYLGFGRASTRNLSWNLLQNIVNAPNLLTEQTSGAIDVRKCHCIFLHSSDLTNYKCLGPAGSRSILAKIPVNVGHGGVLVHQHSGHILDYTPCGGITTQTLNFDLRSSDNEPVDLRGGFVSFTLLFALAPVH